MDKFLYEIELSSDEPKRVCKALLEVAHSNEDGDWCLEKFLGLMSSSNKDVAGLAATCIGHLARIRGDMNKELLKKVLEPYLNKSSISGRVQDALDDIEIYL